MENGESVTKKEEGPGSYVDFQVQKLIKLFF